LFYRLRELLRGDQARESVADRGHRHGAPQPAQRGLGAPAGAPGRQDRARCQHGPPPFHPDLRPAHPRVGPPMAELPGSVLFCCTRNAIRSPMAEGILKHFHGRRIYVDSVGVRESEVDPFAVVVMDEIGIDISRHRSKTFDDLEDGSFDLIITLSPEAQHRAVELTRTMACEVEFWNTFDPSLVEGNRETRLQAYRDVRDQLKRRIEERFTLDLKPQQARQRG